MIFWLLLLLTSSLLPSIPPFPGATVAQQGPSSLPYQLQGWVPAAFHCPSLGKTMNLTSFFQMGTQEAQKSVSVSQNAFFFSPLELPLSGEQWVYCLWGENTGFLTRRRVPFSDMLY